MTHAYDEILIERASDTLGRMLDFAIHSLHQSISSMMDLFCASGLAGLFGRGDIRVIAGMSGIELAYETLERSGLSYERVSPRHTRSLSPEYWCGRALAALQWETCLPFERVMSSFPAAEFISEYSRKRSSLLDGLPAGISEADRYEALRSFGISFVSDAVRGSLSLSVDQAPAVKGDTPLKIMRKRNGLSQSQLADASGIPLRTIQQYEQRQKDIGKARAEYLIALSAVLSCDPASLLEKKQG